MTAIKTYHRPDGVVGCGFYGEFGGLWQHSIAWPDQSATRMRFEDLEERQIEVRDCVACGPCENLQCQLEPVAVDATTAASTSALEDTDLPVNIEVDPFTPPGVENVADSPFSPEVSEAANIRAALTRDPDMSNRDVIAFLHSHGVEVSTSQVTRERRAMKAAAETTE
jgi:hypothetical protein